MSNHHHQPPPGGHRPPGPPSGGSWSPLPPHLYNRPPSPYVPPHPGSGGVSPGINMFVGAPRIPPPYIPCPRPRWPSQGPASPLPWHPHMMVPGHQGSPPPQRMGSPGPRPFRMPMHPVSENGILSSAISRSSEIRLAGYLPTGVLQSGLWASSTRLRVRGSTARTSTTTAELSRCR